MKINKSKKVSDKSSSEEMIELSVMKKIYGFEKKRTTFLFTEFSLLIGMFLLLGLSFLLLVISLMNQAEVFDMFQLFTQDPDTIRQYFWDTMHTVYLETPMKYVVLSLLFLGGAGIIFLAFRKQLPTLLQKLQSIRRFSKRYQ